MITTTNLTRTFINGTVTTPVLRGIDLTIDSGEFVSIMGRSGAGKSTLLYQISLLDEPTSGEIVIEGINVRTMSADEKSAFRLNKFGFVFQDYALLPELTALENVAMPLLMQGLDKKAAYEKAEKALAKVHLAHRVAGLPSQLSGGEQQRVSIARAVAHEPGILFADEPTANLDNESSQAILAIFTEFYQAGQTIIMVTHEQEFASHAERIIKIDDGKIVSDVRSKS
jgi:putative ABC transport system ATP-binding protein